MEKPAVPLTMVAYGTAITTTYADAITFAAGDRPWTKTIFNNKTDKDVIVDVCNGVAAGNFYVGTGDVLVLDNVFIAASVKVKVASGSSTGTFYISRATGVA